MFTFTQTEKAAPPRQKEHSPQKVIPLRQGQKEHRRRLFARSISIR